MIYTLTINPSVDKTIYVDNFETNKLNKVVETFLDAGGKGINVSKTLKAMNKESIALGFVGGGNGTFIKNKLDELNIKHDFIEIKENTRENIKVVDQNGKLTELNEKGPLVSKEEISKLITKIQTTLKENDIIVLSGSVCKGVDIDIYKRIIEIAHKAKTISILDTSGDLLKEGLKAKPSIIKPNLIELQELNNNKNQEDICLDLLKLGIDEIVLSLGKDGALYYSKDFKYKLEPMNIKVKSTVGAGDAMVAGLALAYEAKLNIEDKLKLVLAEASGACLTEGTNPASEDLVNKLIKEVKLINLCK